MSFVRSLKSANLAQALEMVAPDQVLDDELVNQAHVMPVQLEKVALTPHTERS